jgi:hypothetical protein
LSGATIEQNEDIQNDNNGVYTDKGLLLVNINTPDLLPYSGTIVHGQNISPVQRDIEQTEVFQFILEF